MKPTAARPGGGDPPALPAEVKAELRRLLAEILVADYRAEMKGDPAPTVARLQGRNRGRKEKA